MTRSITRRARRGARALAALALGLAPALAAAAHPFQIPLKDASGNVITAASTAPYSPDRSCGGCHDTGLITQGYHFQQGRTDGGGWLSVSDNFLGALLSYDSGTGDRLKGTGAWWKLSDGMYGKW